MGKGERLTVLRAGEGEPLNLRGADMRIKAGAAKGGGAFSFVESREPAGFAAAPHIHHEAVEAFYVLKGQYVSRARTARRRWASGGSYFIPKGIRHSLRLLARLVVA